MKSTRGMWLVVAIFVAGGIALAGLFLAPRGSPIVPSTAPTTVPAPTAARP